jgi:hypothetical protein
MMLQMTELCYPVCLVMDGERIKKGHLELKVPCWRSIGSIVTPTKITAMNMHTIQLIDRL